MLDTRVIRELLVDDGTAPADGAALPCGAWVFSAAEEDTSDTYSHGRCVGSAVGIVDAGGALRTLERLSLDCKIEGIAVSSRGDAIDLLLVTDADDRRGRRCCCRGRCEGIGRPPVSRTRHQQIMSLLL